MIASTYSASVEKSFSEERRRLLKGNLLKAVVRHGANSSEKQLILEPDLLRFTIVLDVDVDRHRETAITGLRHLVRGLLDYCNTQYDM